MPNLDCAPSLTREEYSYMATVAEEAERFLEMRRITDAMVRRTSAHGDFTADERNLIAISHKKLVDARRASWRKIVYAECDAAKRNSGQNLELVKGFRERIEAEIGEFCGMALSLLDSHLIPSALSSECKVFFLKMKGDYHRYIAEFKIGGFRKNAALRSMAAYEEAEVIALRYLEPTHPTRLGLALNFAVLCYEILHLLEKASEIAERGFEDAIRELDSLTPKSYKHAVLQLELLRSNYTLWDLDAKDEAKRTRINSWSSS